MEKRHGLITFLTALVPGLGQMYLGLIQKGIQLFILFLLIQPVFSIIGLGYIGHILKLVIWCYAFFDTFDLARRLDRGENIKDTDFIFKKYMGENQNDRPGTGFHGYSLNKGIWLLCGWGLIIIGILAIINLMFGTNELYGLIKSYISTYFIPVVLIGAGFYMLFRFRK